MPRCDAFFCDNAATVGEYDLLCDSCERDQIACDKLECDCCSPGYEPMEYMTADVAYDMRGGATPDDVWYGDDPYWD